MRKTKFYFISFIILIVIIVLNILVQNQIYNGHGELIKKQMIIFTIIYSIIVFVIYSILILIYKKKYDSKVTKISKYMNNILNGDYSLDIRDYEEGALSILKNDIYKLTIKLKEQTENALNEKNTLELILSDISHQIKTPLTSMYVINDILINSNLTKKERLEFLNKNQVQLEKIDWLVASLLKISRLDNGFIKLKIEKNNSNDLINKSLEGLLIPIELKNQKIIKSVDDFNLDIDLNWTIEAISNIIKNAYEHTPNNGIIKICMNTNPLYSCVKIEDNGVGISKKDLPHIFERFYKGKHQKTSIGIGLNMAKKIIELENGTIDVQSKEGKYTVFEIRFYKNIV